MTTATDFIPGKRI